MIKQIRWPGSTALMTMAAATLMFVVVSDAPGRCGRIVHADEDIIASQYCSVLPVSISTDGSTTLTFDPVRVSINASGLIGVGSMDTRAWDILPTTPGFTEIEVGTQDLSLSTSPWWFTAPSIPTSSQVIYTVYMGNDEQKRDNGLGFYGADTASAATHADFDLTDNFAIVVRMEKLDGAPNGLMSILDRWNGGNGYELTLEPGGIVRARVDGQTCDSAVWDGSLATWRMLYESPTLSLLKDGGLSGSACNTGLGAIGTAAVDPTLGGIADPVVIRDFSINRDTTTSEIVVARWTMNGIDCTETSAVAPNYSGTCPDFSGNGHTLTYAFNRSQTGITFDVGALALTGSSAFITLPAALNDFLGEPFRASLFDGTGVNTNMPFFTILNDGVNSMGVPVDFGWAMLFTAAALFFGVMGFVFTSRNVFVAMLLFLVVLAYGNINGAVERWYVVLWFLIALLTIGAVQWVKER